MRLSLLPLRPHAPASRMAQPSAPRAASWPVVSITVLLCVSALLPPIVLTAMNATLVALAVGVVLWANRKIDPQLWHLVLPFAVIVMLGLIMGVQAERYKYFKDAWYVGNPVLVVLTGYVLYRLRPDVGAGLRAFVVGGFLVALWQMRAYYSDPSLLLLPADTIRRLVGTAHYAPVAALVILLLLAGRWRAELRLPTWLLGLMFGVIAAAVLGVFSRTALMVVLIAIAARLGAFAQREWLRLGLPFLLLVCVAFGMQIFFDVESDRALKTFVGKLADNVRWNLVNAAGNVETLGIAEFTDAPSMPHPHLFLRATDLAQPNERLADFGRRFVAPSATPGCADLGMLLALSQGVADAVSYQKYSTDVTTTAPQAFDAGIGVCQDQAHVMVAICRSLGIPARYVSGYFYAANEPDLASHAWVDVCLNVTARRWVSIDVTHSCPIDQRHVRLAVGTDYNACPPIKGIRHGGGQETMTVAIGIEPV